ncbi:MAG: hypothetical protein HY521_10840 [Proteobacteria bacterium]|nr:hypothetical protein [Pseudomonadota bacterium]
MPKFPEPGWMAAFRERVNADAEMAVIGDWFTTAIGFDFGGVRYVVQVAKGKIGEVVAEPRLDAPAAFAMVAPLSVWRRFLSPKPEPLYHDFFAMLMRVPEFHLEGDTLVAMQNARALHRMMNIMRETGAADA